MQRLGPIGAGLQDELPGLESSAPEAVVPGGRKRQRIFRWGVVEVGACCGVFVGCLAAAGRPLGRGDRAGWTCSPGCARRCVPEVPSWVSWEDAEASPGPDPVSCAPEPLVLQGRRAREEPAWQLGSLGSWCPVPGRLRDAGSAAAAGASRVAWVRNPGVRVASLGEQLLGFPKPSGPGALPDVCLPLVPWPKCGAGYSPPRGTAANCCVHFKKKKCIFIAQLDT